MNFFVLNCHKYYSYSQGRLNKTLFEKICQILSSDNEIRTTVIENGYTISEEIEKFKWADIIIFQTPMNWFSIPWLFKKYIDEVFQYGTFFIGSDIYGSGGLMHNKKYMLSVTCNVKKEDFRSITSFFYGRSEDDILLPFHLLNRYCAMSPLKSFFCYDVVHNPDIDKYLNNLEKHLHNYVLN